MPCPPRPFARRLSRLAGTALAVALVLAGCSRSQESTGAAAGEPGPQGPLLPAFELVALAGGQLGSEDLKGKVVIYDFWATWCGPCHIQADILHALYPGVAGNGVEFVAISVGEPEDLVRDFLRDRPYPYPVLVDPEDRMSSELRILGLPTLIVVDGEGRVVYRNTGISDRETIERALERAGAA